MLIKFALKLVTPFASSANI